MHLVRIHDGPVTRSPAVGSVACSSSARQCSTPPPTAWVASPLVWPAPSTPSTSSAWISRAGWAAISLPSRRTCRHPETAGVLRSRSRTSKLTTPDYRLTYSGSGSTYTLTRLSDGQTVSMSGSGTTPADSSFRPPSQATQHRKGIVPFPFSPMLR